MPWCYHAQSAALLLHSADTMLVCPCTGERGVGGSKCGATAVNAMLFKVCVCSVHNLHDALLGCCCCSRGAAGLLHTEPDAWYSA